MSRAPRGTAFSRRRFLGAAAGIAVGAAGAGALELGWHRDSNAPPRSHYRAIVVGSGYGGGVSALRLGEAGVNTLILEKGRLWDSADADGKRFSRMLPADNRAGWFTSVPPSLVPSFRGVSMAQVAQHASSPQPVQAGICDKVVHGAHTVFRGTAVGGVRRSRTAGPLRDSLRMRNPASPGNRRHWKALSVEVRRRSLRRPCGARRSDRQAPEMLAGNVPGRSRRE